MGRRKEPKTLDELRSEKEYTEKKLMQSENRMKILKNKYSKEKQKARTHHLCEEAGDAESIVQELKVMEQTERRQFFQIAFACQEAQEFLQKWREERAKNNAETDMAKDY